MWPKPHSDNRCEAVSDACLYLSHLALFTSPSLSRCPCQWQFYSLWNGYCNVFVYADLYQYWTTQYLKEEQIYNLVMCRELWNNFFCVYIFMSYIFSARLGGLGGGRLLLILKGDHSFHLKELKKQWKPSGKILLWKQNAHQTFTHYRTSNTIWRRKRHPAFLQLYSTSLEFNGMKLFEYLHCVSGLEEIIWHIFGLICLTNTNCHILQFLIVLQLHHVLWINKFRSKGKGKVHPRTGQEGPNGK